MYYEIKGYNAVKPVESVYTDIAHNKGEKSELVKKYKGYLRDKDIDMFKVSSYLNNGTLKEIVTYS